MKVVLDPIATKCIESWKVEVDEKIPNTFGFADNLKNNITVPYLHINGRQMKAPSRSYTSLEIKKT